MTEPASPLSEANPQSLEELMSRDPLKLQRVDRVRIVTELRRMREVWLKAELNSPSKGKKPASGGAPPAMPSAEDIGI